MRGLHRILVVRTDRIGDVVLSLPVVTALRRAYPDAYLAMLVHPDVGGIVEGHPDLNGILWDGRGERGFRGFFRLVGRIRQGRFDVALLLHPTLRLATALVLSGIPVRVGTGYRFYAFLFNRRMWEHRKDSRRHEVEYNLSLAGVLGVDVSRVDFRLPIDAAASKTVERRLRGMGIGPVHSLVVIHPGSKGSALEWPRARFAALARRLVRETRTSVVVTGARGEEKLVEEVVGKDRERICGMVGCLSLKELVALLNGADLVVANSTGPLHIAAAVGTEVVGLYPPVTAMHARRWGPYGRMDRVLMPDVSECSKCRGAACSRWNCMELISVEEVWKRVEETWRSRGVL